MKKILIIVAAVLMGSMASAQISGIGARIGGGQGYGAELSTLWGAGSNRIEADLGWSNADDYNSFSLTGIYQWTGEIGSGFGWFAGVGARVAFRSGNSSNDFALALAGQAGVEYNFSAIPIQLSLDIRPAFYLIPNTQFHWGDIALGIRYRF